MIFQRHVRLTKQGTTIESSVLFAVLSALVIRLVVVGFLYQGQLNPRRDHWPFGYETGRIARSIALGEGFGNPFFQRTGPTALMMPLYPYIVAGVFKLSGIYTTKSALILLALNSLLSALTCVPIFYLARASFGANVAIWAAWAWAFFPYAIELSADWIWETCLSTLLLTLLLVISARLARAEKTSSFAVWAGFGLLWGITALSNPAALALLPFLLGWVGYRGYRTDQAWAAKAAVAMLVMVIAVAPWLLRNYATFGQVIPFRDNFWLEVWVGNHGDASLRPGDKVHPSANASEEDKYNHLGEVIYIAGKRRDALAFIRGHPLWFVGMVVRRAQFTWTGFWSLPSERRWDELLDPERPFAPIHILFCTLLSALAFAGMFRSIREGNRLMVPYAFTLLIYPLVYYTTNLEFRYRHPIEPELVILATYACVGFRGNRSVLEADSPEGRTGKALVST